MHQSSPEKRAGQMHWMICRSESPTSALASKIARGPRPPVSDTICFRRMKQDAPTWPGPSTVSQPVKIKAVRSMSSHSGEEIVPPNHSRRPLPTEVVDVG